LQHAEYRDGNYERSFVISEPVDTAKIEAVFKDGVLRLTLPKATPAPATKIPVKAA
jgi:HSP20 family molecular chaperone IbpA